MAERLSALCTWLSRAAMALAGAGLVLMTALITWQVFARYVLRDSPSWTEQASLLALIWFILLAGAAGVHQNFHLRLTLLETSLPKAWSRRLQIVGHFLVLLFGVMMAASGVELALATRTHELPALGVSRAVTYIPVALSGALIAIFSLDRMVGTLTGRKEKDQWN
ncbi:MAG: TRAP transporter small permease [Hyphomonas sp.]|uniref:TRAP transporter small permease n=1 Tax=Hyphomonas sp. TaxID=87 RepID=UPI003529737F